MAYYDFSGNQYPERLLDEPGTTASYRQQSLREPTSSQLPAHKNVGISPDIEVEFDPKKVREGHDPQLEKAVEVAMDLLRKNPLPSIRSRHIQTTSKKSIMPNRGDADAS